MDERKRSRMEIITNGNLNRASCQQNIYLNTSITDNVMSMVGGGSSSTIATSTSTTATAAALHKNLFLTICEDNSSESQEEFYTIDSSCIKQDTQYAHSIGASGGSVTTTTSKLGLNVGLSAINAQTAAALLPATVQLPSGCEIYLVKEYVNPPPLTPTNAPRTVISSATSSSATITKTSAIEKYKSGTITTAPVATATTNRNYEAGRKTAGLQIVRKTMPMTTQTHTTNQTQIVNNNNNIINKNSNNNNSSSCCNKNNDIDEQRSEFDKQSELLEAYKKRDDKRRATHNEVERRRRDKINSWIFKLKEMLPSEIPNLTIPIDSESCMNSNSNSSTSDQQQQSLMQQGQQQQQRTNNSNNNNNNNGCRNLPCDSKSQILIKACEYIKSMQQEMKSLRECLTENENLRQYNERLQNELNQLKNEQQSQSLTTNVLDEEENIVDEDDDVVMVHCNGHLTGNDSDDAVDGHTDDDLTHNLNSNPNSNFNVTLNSLNNLGGNGDSLFMTTPTNNMVTVIDVKRDLLMQNYVD